MDVPNSQNVTKGNFLSATSNKLTRQTQEINSELPNHTNEPRNSQTKMHVSITAFVLGLLLLIVVYGLIMQNYWLVGIVCFPVIAAGAYKIFDRYL